MKGIGMDEDYEVVDPADYVSDEVEFESCALNRFRRMQNHNCGGVKTITTEPDRGVKVKCSCRDEAFWCWNGFEWPELKGYWCRFFRDDRAKKKLLAFVNGILVPVGKERRVR